MEPFSAAILTSLSTDLAKGVVSALGRATRQKIAGSPAQAALERSLQAGLVALAAQTTTAQPEQEEHLAGIFEDFFHRPAVWVQVSGLLNAKPLDRERLHEEFVDAGYDETTLPHLDFDAGLDAFTAAFQIAADGENELQGIIQLGQLRQQTQMQRELLEEVRKLVTIFQQSQLPLTVSAGALRGPAGQTIYIFAGDHSGSILNIESELEGASQITGGRSPEVPLDDPLRTYLGMVVRRSGGLPLGPLDPSGQEAAHLALLKVFINVDAGERILKEESILRRYTSAIAHVHENDRVIILGDPGSGKSTVFRYLSFCLANALLEPDGQWLANLAWIEEQMAAPPSEDTETHTTKFIERLQARRREWMMPSETGREGQSGEPELEEITRHWSRGAAIPLLIELRNFAQTDFDPDSPAALWKYVEAQLEHDDVAEAIPALRRAAQRGAVLFLFDGVDEVAPGKRPAVWKAIQSVERGPYGACRWIAACRILSFVEKEAPAGVPAQTLAPLTEDQIEAFVERWYAALVEVGERTATQAREMTAELQAAAKSPRLRDIARNPMLLTIMALVQTYHGTLPNERARLYQQCVETLLLRWQRYKEEGQQEMPGLLAELGVTQQELERLLWEIAWQAHSRAQKLEEDEPEEEQATADIPEAEVVEIARRFLLDDPIRAWQFIEYTERRAHLLLGRGGVSGRVFTFPHRTFQEYLAACHLAADRRLGYRAAELARQGDYWREVLNLAAGTLVFNQNNREKALDAIAQMLPPAMPSLEDTATWRRVWLAGEMTDVVGRSAAEADEIGTKLLPPLREYLAVLLGEGLLNPVQRAAAGVALSRLGDPRSGVGVIVRDGPRLPGSRTLSDSVSLPDIAWGEAVPAGVYTIGGDQDAYQAFKRRQATIARPFQLARYPLTYAQFDCFIRAADFADARWWAGMPAEEEAYGKRYALRELSEGAFPFANHPRERVSWYQAVAFCRWLSDKLGEEIDLPHEYEWEVAARYPDGRFYPWGPDFDPVRANTNEGGIGRTSAVGIFPRGANPALGLYDLSGNIWEWCRNKYEEPDDDAVDASGARRVVRGGSWDHLQYLARAASRYHSHPNDRYGFVGCRLVRRPPSQAL